MSTLCADIFTCFAASYLIAATVRLLDFQYKVTQYSADTADVGAITTDGKLADKYNVEISNAFSALTSLPDDTNAASSVVPPRRPWLSPSVDILEQKRKPRISGDETEYRRLKGVFKARAKTDLEEFYNKLADDADDGIRRINTAGI